GVELAVEELNAAGGINGRRIEWFFYDGESQTQRALNATRRLLSQDRVDILVGGGSMSGIALAMAPLAEQARVPFVSTEGAMSIVTPVAERRFIFKSTVDDDRVLERLADWCLANNRPRVALLADSSGFGQSAVEQMRLVAARRGLQVTYESFNPADTDLTPQLTRIRGGDSQAVVCWTTAPVGVVFLRQARQLGLDDHRQLIHSYGFVAQRYMELAGEAAQGLLLLSVKFPVGDQLAETDPVRAGIMGLTERFGARHRRPPNQYVGQTYDAMMLAAQGLARGGSDRAAVRDAIEGIHGYRGVSGVFTFSAERHSGLSKDDVVMLDWRNGRFNLVA
ncbi:MAG TPA: ABC transporter substrate-binding protein, partial [Crenalkalicoccus sp.]|nr:ABC transporter substrate-binding protein [Crenalkalicoccus sp.]